MNKALYLLARMAVAVLQAMPLLWVARLGRCGGGVVFWLDARHREVALRNMTLTFQDVKSLREIRALAHENFRRIGENYACSVKTAGMTEQELRKVVAVSGVGAAEAAQAGPLKECRIYAAGHFGNFELFSRMSSFIGGYQVAATYRGLRPQALDHILRDLRQNSGTTTVRAPHRGRNSEKSHGRRRAAARCYFPIKARAIMGWNFRFWGVPAGLPARPQSWPCATKPRYSCRFVIAPPWDAGALRSANPSPRTRTVCAAQLKRSRAT